MKIKLNWIEVENFKGLKNFRAEFNGESCLVIGKNATGKTTLIDAFFFLLTDSNSEQNSKFNLLELQESGDVVNNQDAVVEAEFFIGLDGKKVRLRKKYKQKWTTKKGSTHTTEHFFDGVPVKKNDFEKRLSGIIDPNIIRSIADVQHFCHRLKWDKRREILMEIAGRISDIEICRRLGANELAEMLDDKTPDDVKKMLSHELKEIEKSIDNLPERIDELHKIMPEVGDYDEREVLNGIKEIDAQIEEKKREILATRTGLSISEKEREINQLKIEVSVKTQEAIRDTFDKQKLLIEETDKLKRNDIKLRDQYENAHNYAHHSEMSIIEYEKEKSKLVEKWIAIDALTFAPAENCFACGQKLTDELIDKQHDEFNFKKAGDLEPIDKRGRWLTQEIKDLNKRISLKKEQMIKFKKDRNENADNLRELERQIDLIESEKQSAIESKTKSLNERIAKISDDIKKEMEDITPAVESLENDIVALEKERKLLDDIKLDFVQRDRCQRSIKAREEQLREFGAAYEDVKRKIDMLSDFSRWKAEFIEKNINDKFELTRWKLFENYQSGGYRDICEPTFDGVPYSSDLNHGAKINVGLDVIRTLQKHYKISMPVFIDNAESISNWMVDLDSQMIQLQVMPNVEKLEVIED